MNTDPVTDALDRHDPDVVAVQAPQGLKRSAAEVAEAVRSHGAEPVLLGDPCFGACDPAPRDVASLGVDLVLHLGHTSMNVDRVPTVHLPFESDADVEPAVRRAAEHLPDRAGVVTTTQHLGHLDDVRDALRDSGVEPVVADRGRRDTAPGQVLGCDLGNARVDAPALLYVGTGRFHPIGAHVATGKPVVSADPGTGEATDVTEHAERFVRRRFGQVAAARDAETWGIVVGHKPGQRRVPLARKCRDLLRDAGRDATLVYVDLLTPEALLTLGMDAYVNTACPRLSLDDTPRFDRPLLSPAELLLVLGETEDYRFDEYLRSDEYL